MATFLPATSPPALRDFAALMAGNVAERERQRQQEARDRAYSLALVQSALSEREAARQDVAQQFGMERAASTDELARQQAARTYGINMLNARANLAETGMRGRQIRGTEEQWAIENRRRAALDRLNIAAAQRAEQRQAGEDVFSRYKFGVEKTQTEAQEKRLADAVKTQQEVARDAAKIRAAEEERAKKVFEMEQPAAEARARFTKFATEQGLKKEQFEDIKVAVLDDVAKYVYEGVPRGPNEIARRRAKALQTVQQSEYGRYTDLAADYLEKYVVGPATDAARSEARKRLSVFNNQPTSTPQEWEAAAEYVQWLADPKDTVAAAVRQKATNAYIAGDEATRARIPASLVDQDIARRLQEVLARARVAEEKISTMTRKEALDSLVQITGQMNKPDFAYAPPEQQEETRRLARALRIRAQLAPAEQSQTWYQKLAGKGPGAPATGASPSTSSTTPTTAIPDFARIMLDFGASAQ